MTLCELSVYKGFDLQELQAAFDKVAKPGDWRAPIYSRCLWNDDEITVAAVEFFTGVTPDIDWMSCREEDFEDGYFRVKSPGYRDGPAGP